MSLDVEQMITDRIVSHGATVDDAKKLIQLVGDLADRKGLDHDALLMVTLDTCGHENFEVGNLITQLRLNCGEFEI